MKRVFAVIGFSYMLGIILLNYIAEDYSLILCAASAVLFLLSLIIRPVRKHKELPLALISILLSALIFTGVRHYVYTPATEYADTKCQITAQVLSFPTESSSGNKCYLIKTKTINGEEKQLRMYLYTPYDVCAEPYDEISFSSYPFIIGDNDESYYRYFRSKLTYLGAYTRYEVSLRRCESKPLMAFFTSFKGLSFDIMENYLNEETAGFARGILFGDKILIPDETLDDFSRSGASHILAVSGLHMSVWVFGLYALLRKFHVKDRTAGLICIFTAFAVACLASFSMSVLRAAIMTSVYFSASLFGRKSDPLNSLGTSVFILCLFNPFVVCDVSFLMTVFATLGIILASDILPKIQFRLKGKKGGKILSYMATGMVVSLTASLFVYPVSVNVFGTVSLLGWLTNLLILPVLTPCMYLCGLLIAYPTFHFIAYPVKHVLQALVDYILRCVRLVADIPYSFIETDSFILCSLLPVTVAFVIFLIYNIREKRFSLSSLLCFLSVTVVTLFI